MNKILLTTFGIIILILLGYIIFLKNDVNGVVSVVATSTPEDFVKLEPEKAEPPDLGGVKTFVFDNFHGSKNISLKFQFQYPAFWNNEGQYFSPQKIDHYDLFSVRAPFYFDLIRADIFDQTEFKNQIDSDKRKSPDSHGKINDQPFKRYDLIDYGSYGGDSAGRVLIYVGPNMSIDGVDYILVFHWEE